MKWIIALAVAMLLAPGRGAAAQPGEHYRDLICAAPWPCEEALRVSWCESRWDPLAYRTGNYGLFQVNQVHWARVGGDLEQLYDPEVNVRVAYEIWREQGWTPWACKP